MTFGELDTVVIPKGFELVVVKVHDPKITRMELEWVVSLQNPDYHIWERVCKNIRMTDAFVKDSEVTLQQIVDKLYRDILKAKELRNARATPGKD